jgi:uncharacterized protein YlxW (UPF0749 family)
MSEIDAREFGQLEAEVRQLQRDVTELRDDVKKLLALANKSKGGLWMGMAMASFVGGIVTFVTGKFIKG